MSSPSIYSFEGYDYDNYYSDFDDEYYMSDDDDDDDDDDDNAFNFFSALVPFQLSEPPTFLECKKLKEYLDDGTFSDVIIRVEDKKYNLHRVVLSLKSAYFQKLFAHNFIEHNQKEIELKSIEIPILDCIVTYIYENDLESFITSENMTKLLIALDYLQIEIDQSWFFQFIQNNSEVQMIDLFEIFNFLVFHSAYPWLLAMLLKHFSKNLVKISQTEYFTTIPFEYLKKILLCMQVRIGEDEEPRYITKICAKWICSDIANRSGHIVEIVNAIKYRYSKMFFLIDKNYNINCSDTDNKEQYIEKKLEELLNYSVEFIPAACADSFKIRNEETSFGPRNPINYKQQMEELLKSGDLSDICVKVSNKSFPLHRAVLASKSPYFHNLFTTNIENDSNEFQIEDMDEKTFSLILRYIYFETLEITSDENIVFLIKASERFEMKELYIKVEKYVLEKTSQIANVLELFAYLRTTCDYAKLLIHTEKYILENWSKVTEMSDFVHMSIDTLQDILSLSNVFVQDESEILKLCSKWMMYDFDNRLHRIPSLISSLCRTMLTDNDNQTHIESIKNSSSEKTLMISMKKLLSSLNPVNTIKSEHTSYSFKRPQFIASSDNTLYFYAYNESLNLHELEYLRLVIPNESINLSSACATVMDSNLFVHFNDNYFYAQNLATKRCVSLTSDEISTQPWRSQLVNCNGNVYMCYNDEGRVLRYSMTLNRWLKVPPVDPSIKRNVQRVFASDGKHLFSVCAEHNEHSFAVHKYVDSTKTWLSLPELVDSNRTYEYPISACFSNKNLFVAFNSFSRSYNFRTRRWTNVLHGSNEYRDFFSVNPYQNNLLFFLGKSKVAIYNIYKKSWTDVRHDDSRKVTFLNIIQ